MGPNIMWLWWNKHVQCWTLFPLFWWQSLLLCLRHWIWLIGTPLHPQSSLTSTSSSLLSTQISPIQYSSQSPTVPRRPGKAQMSLWWMASPDCQALSCPLVLPCPTLLFSIIFLCSWTWQTGYPLVRSLNCGALSWLSIPIVLCIFDYREIGNGETLTMTLSLSGSPSMNLHSSCLYQDAALYARFLLK